MWGVLEPLTPPIFMHFALKTKKFLFFGFLFFGFLFLFLLFLFL